MGFGTGDLQMGVTFVLYDKATEAAKTSGAAIGDLEKKVTSAASGVDKGAASIVGSFAKITAVAAASVLPFAAAIDAASKFEFTIREAYAKGAAVNEQEVSRLREQAFALGEASFFSAQKIADAQVIMAQSGFRNYQIMKALPEVLNLATAGNIDLAKATLVASDTMFQFNLRATDFKRITDVIVTGANESSQSVEDLASAMKYIGPTAKALGVGLEEAVAYTEMMAQAGMRGTLGARAFGSALTALAGGNKQIVATLSEIGVDPFAGQGRSFVGIIGLVRQLEKALNGRTPEDTAKIMKRLFGAEAFQEITQLLKGEIEIAEGQFLKAGDALQYFADRNNKALGSAKKTADMMRDTLFGDIQTFKSTWASFMIQVGRQFEDVLRPLVRILTWFLKVMKDFVQTPLGRWMLIAAAGAGVLLTGILTLQFAIKTLLPLMSKMIVEAAALAIEFWPVTLALAAIAAGVYVVNESLDQFNKLNEGGQREGGMLGWFQKAGATISTLIDVWKTWDGMTFNLSQKNVNSLDKLGIKDDVLAMATWVVRIKEFFKGVGEGFMGWWSLLKPAILEVKESFKFLLTAIFGEDFVKAGGAIKIFTELGKVFGYVILFNVVAPLLVLAKAITLITSAIAGLIELVKNNWDYVKVIFASAGGPGGSASAMAEAMANRAIRKSKTGTPMPSSNGVTVSSDESSAILMQLLAKQKGGAIDQQGPLSNESLQKIFGSMSPNDLKSITTIINMDGKEVAKHVEEIQKVNKSRK